MKNMVIVILLTGAVSVVSAREYHVSVRGNDLYEGGSFSQGAAAHNGWSVFLERAGNDTYLYTKQARAGGSDYHGGSSLAYFVDARGEDSYPGYGNDMVRTGGVYSIFADLPDGNFAPGEEQLDALLAP